VQVAVMVVMGASCKSASNSGSRLIKVLFVVLNGCFDMPNCCRNMLTRFRSVLARYSTMRVLEFVGGFVEVIEMTGFGCIDRSEESIGRR
jgi:hypothetical protein